MVLKHVFDAKSILLANSLVHDFATS